MKLTVLGSSSMGNSYILQNRKEALIIEAGIKSKDVLQALDFNVTKVVGCLVTHEHQDHAGYATDVAGLHVPVFCSQGTLDAVKQRNEDAFAALSISSLFKSVKAGEQFRVGGFTILPFNTVHDAAEPLGFLINHSETGNFLFATDTYYLPCKFAHLNNIMIECNYDKGIVEANVQAGKLAPVIVNRLYKSHLSLDGCINALQANDLSEVNKIILLHLSAGNSNARQFKRQVELSTGKNVLIADAGLTTDFNVTPF
jgi:phosphoribosyl 1,2-cyclic phosphodiesterase